MQVQQAGFICARCGCERRGETPSRYERHRTVCLECLSPQELQEQAHDVDRYLAFETAAELMNALR